MKQPMSNRAKEDLALGKVIRETFEESNGTYGSPRVHRSLRNQGIRIGRKRVERLMRDQGLSAKQNRRKKRFPGGRPAQTAPNLVKQDFWVESPDLVWSSDITYIRWISGWLYLAVVMDLHSRKIVGWAIEKRMTTNLVLQALDMAVKSRKPKPGLIIHTDQGSQYGSYDWLEYLKVNKIKASMSRRGNCHDNAAQEAFFRSLKGECVQGRIYPSLDAARREMFDYIEMFYNPKRLHSHLGYLSPDEFEQIQPS